MGRPRKKIDVRQVETLAQIGCTLEEIAAVVGCSADTLQRRFAVVIKKGRLSLNMSVRRMQYERAAKGSDTMLIWLGKQYLNQKNFHAVDHTGAIDLNIKEKRTGDLYGELAELLSGGTIGADIKRILDEASAAPPPGQSGAGRGTSPGADLAPALPDSPH